MNLNNDLARLKRAGDEHSTTINRLRESIDEVAKFLSERLLGSPMSLARGYSFSYWPSGTWELQKTPSGNSSDNVLLTNTTKPRKDVLNFAADIAGGWLKEVVAGLEAETQSMKEIIADIDSQLPRST